MATTIETQGAHELPRTTLLRVIQGGEQAAALAENLDRQNMCFLASASKDSREAGTA